MCISLCACTDDVLYSCNIQNKWRVGGEWSWQRWHWCWWWNPLWLCIVNSGCSSTNPSSTFEFFRNLNTTLADLRREITVNKTYFGTQQQAMNPVYTMFQCRKYLSTAECVSCFDTAALDIRSICKLANGARVIYDDCFLRYPHCLITSSFKTNICAYF